MKTNRCDVDILIVGAGPVGLFLANECARRGLRWRLVESRASQSIHSKALAIMPRTLEIFDMAGLAGPFVERANRVTAASVATPSRTLARLQFAPAESPYPYVAMVPQDVTEQLLAEELKRKGGSVEYLTSFVSAVQHDDYVQLSLNRQGVQTGLTCAFVVGCDGAHSTVRRLLDLQFEGAAYEDLFMLADIETNEAFPADEMQICPNELGPLAIFPMSATRRRVVAMIRDPQGDAPSLDLVRQMLVERAPAGIEARSMQWSSYFRIHHRYVTQLREGRIFVAGDAAHIHSPFGAQGMNTGLQDIWNLAWKLDLAVHGHATDVLLESYTLERRPVIKHVVDVTHFMTKALGTPNKFAQTLRNTMIPLVSRLAPVQHAMVQTLSELGVAYEGSPIVEGPGNRFFDELVRGGQGILSRFLLLCGKGADRSSTRAAEELAGSFPGSVELRTVPGQGVTLVRPDGYIAYSAHDGDLLSAVTSIRSVLERQLIGRS